MQKLKRIKQITGFCSYCICPNFYSLTQAQLRSIIEYYGTS